MRTASTLRIGLVPPLWARVAPATAGGVEYVVHLLADELVRRGHRVTVFAARDSVTHAEIAALTQANLIESMKEGRAAEYEYFETCNIAEALQKGASFDLFHFHVGAYAIPLGALSRTPVLHTLHNPVTPDANWILSRYREVPVTAVSRQQIDVIPEHRRRGIRVIHNACDFDSYEFCGSPGEYLVFLGRMGPGKSPLDAIHIAREAGLPIVLAGQPLDAQERAYFNSAIQPLIDDRMVNYVGAVDRRQKVDLLKRASALLFPIQAEEAFGLVMIEAMACGTPVIAVRRGAVEEVVRFGTTGFYADSAAELASFVPKALSLDRRLVREHARQRFGHVEMVNEYLESYDAILSGRWGGRVFAFAG